MSVLDGVCESVFLVRVVPQRHRAARVGAAVVGELTRYGDAAGDSIVSICVNVGKGAVAGGFVAFRIDGDHAVLDFGFSSKVLRFNEVFPVIRNAYAALDCVLSHRGARKRQRDRSGNNGLCALFLCAAGRFARNDH